MRERAVIWWSSKQHSNWKEALKGVPKKLNITNMKFGIWKIWHKLEWINKRVNVFKRCYFWYFVSGNQFLRLLIEIILWVIFSVRSVQVWELFNFKNEDIKTTSTTVFSCLHCYLWTYFTFALIVAFQRASNVCWVHIEKTNTFDDKIGYLIRYFVVS